MAKGHLIFIILVQSIDRHRMVCYHAKGVVLMLLFGHVGITLASAALGFGLKGKICHGTIADGVEETLLTRDSYPSNTRSYRQRSFFSSLANRVDIRFLLAGSMLPDIIDKPVGIYLFRETFSSGRIFSHTLLFLVLLAVVGLLIRSYSGKTWGLALSIGTLFHLVLDQMWRTPKTLFWPIFGIAFERVETTYWLGNILQALLSEPEVYAPEIIGLIAFVWFTWELLRHRAIIKFLKQGRVY